MQRKGGGAHMKPWKDIKMLLESVLRKVEWSAFVYRYKSCVKATYLFVSHKQTPACLGKWLRGHMIPNFALLWTTITLSIFYATASAPADLALVLIFNVRNFETSKFRSCKGFLVLVLNISEPSKFRTFWVIRGTLPTHGIAPVPYKPRQRYPRPSDRGPWHHTGRT